MPTDGNYLVWAAWNTDDCIFSFNRPLLLILATGSWLGWVISEDWLIKEHGLHLCISRDSIWPPSMEIVSFPSQGMDSSFNCSTCMLKFTKIQNWLYTHFLAPEMEKFRLQDLESADQGPAQRPHQGLKSWSTMPMGHKDLKCCVIFWPH